MIVEKDFLNLYRLFILSFCSKPSFYILVLTAHSMVRGLRSFKESKEMRSYCPYSLVPDRIFTASFSFVHMRNIYARRTHVIGFFIRFSRFYHNNRLHSSLHASWKAPLEFKNKLINIITKLQP